MPRTCNLRPIQVVGDIAYVALTRGYVAMIDADMACVIGQWNWSVSKPPHGLPYARRGGPTGEVRLHYMILPRQPGLVHDHINGDSLDNRRANLRLCSQSQNSMNRVVVEGTWGRGVSYHPKQRRFSARIKINRRNRHLGYFDTAEEASQRRMVEEVALFGEFSPLARPSA